MVSAIHALPLLGVLLVEAFPLPISLAIRSVSPRFRFLKTSSSCKVKVNNKHDMISMGSQCGDLHLSVAFSAR